MTDPIVLHHVSLVVADTARSLAFYTGVLGLTVDESRPDLSFDGAWLKVGTQQIHLLQVSNPDPIEGRPAHGGRDRHVAFSVRDLNAYIDRLESRDVPFTLSRSGRRALFCRDPDGNACELMEQPS